MVVLVVFGEPAAGAAGLAVAATGASLLLEATGAEAVTSCFEFPLSEVELALSELPLSELELTLSDDGADELALSFEESAFLSEDLKDSFSLESPPLVTSGSELGASFLEVGLEYGPGLSSITLLL